MSESTPFVLTENEAGRMCRFPHPAGDNILIPTLATTRRWKLNPSGEKDAVKAREAVISRWF